MQTLEGYLNIERRDGRNGPVLRFSNIVTQRPGRGMKVVASFRLRVSVPDSALMPATGDIEVEIPDEAVRKVATVSTEVDVPDAD